MATIFVGAALGVVAPLLTKLVFDDALFPPGGEPQVGLLALLVGVMLVAIALALLEGCAASGDTRPHTALRFEGREELDLTVLPCFFFDPLWPHNDRRDRYRAAPLKRFDDFFAWRLRPGAVPSYRDFFAGAFAYHWHGRWSAPERERSYFGRFQREFANGLRARG